MSLINWEIVENTLYLYANGKIDSGNSSEAAELIAEGQKQNHSAVIFDADKLSYISSAGLRVLLQLKKTEKDFQVINVHPETYEIFEATGFTEIMDIQKVFKQFDVSGCKIIGEGAKGIVYRYNDDTIIKVYKNSNALEEIKNERNLSRRAFVLGIPTAISFEIVKVGDLYGSVFELLDSKSLSESISSNPNDIEKYADLFASLLSTIHSAKVNEGELPDVKILAAKWLDTSSKYLDDETTNKIQALLDACPSTTNVVHMDYHTNNVLLQNGDAILIDMDTLSCGLPIFDLSNAYTAFQGFSVISQKMTEDFLGMPFELCTKFWNLFFAKYLALRGISNSESIENKIKLLSYLRAIRHIARRGANTNEEKNAINYYAENIPILLAKIDSFEL